MYETTIGTRVLYGAEARLLAGSAWSLTDDLRTCVPDSGSQSFNHLIDIPVLELLTAAQLIVLVDRVTAYLLDANVAAPARTALLDATIAAIFRQAVITVESEILLESEATEGLDDAGDDDFSARAGVVAALLQTCGPEYLPLDTPDPDCIEMESWQEVIDQLCERVLPDRDWQLESIAMDMDPQKMGALKESMGISDDYFIDVVPDASVDDAATAWSEMLHRISGWRPEIWRFGGGIPMPADADIPPKCDILSFSNGQDTHTSTKSGAEHSVSKFRQAKPVSKTRPVALSDVMFEVEAGSEDWSGYVDQASGKVVCLPTDVILSVENGEDPSDYCGDGVEFFDLARKICESDDFLAVPSSFDIHEWSIMRDFAAQVDRDSDGKELQDAIHGSGAFRIFKSTIDRLGLAEQWFRYKDTQIESIVINWLESNSIQWSRTEMREPPF